ncbi:MAG TPA: 30S ribosomal protein S8 [Chloroflexota bacterium]|jgi:small subunit ribosomal protein S8|nr:30S ribosomal protein S8 [Chloroflexota bacterium]
MNISDPIADMLTRIRNGLQARHTQVEMPSSKMKVAIAKILKDEGYIKDFEVTKDVPQPVLRVALKYTTERQSVVSSIKRVSKPGLRRYSKRTDIPLVLDGMGLVIMSTPKGLMSGKEAYKRNLGGEVICEVW